MDPHPTPFPGKRRALPNKKAAPAAANTARKAAAPPAPSAGGRQNRAFGAPRSTNIPAPKPPCEASKPSKTPRTVDRPWRISVAAVKEPKERRKKTPLESTGDPVTAVPDDGGSLPEMPPHSVEPAEECAKKPTSGSAEEPAMAVPDGRGGGMSATSPHSVDPAEELAEKPTMESIEEPPMVVSEDGGLMPPQFPNYAKKSASEPTEEPAMATLDIGDRTPPPSAEVPVAAEITSSAAVGIETPFLTARRCNRCEAVDMMELSSYWVSQIELAASVGKHFASAAFFRLAMECHAEPFSILQDKLKEYIMEHGIISTNSLWASLIEAYGLPGESANEDHPRPRGDPPFESHTWVASATCGGGYYAMKCHCSEGKTKLDFSECGDDEDAEEELIPEGRVSESAHAEEGPKPKRAVRVRFDLPPKEMLK